MIPRRLIILLAGALTLALAMLIPSDARGAYVGVGVGVRPVYSVGHQIVHHIYWYNRDASVYYDPDSGLYYWYEDGQWLSDTVPPGDVYIDPDSWVMFESDASEPYLVNNSVLDYAYDGGYFPYYSSDIVVCDIGVSPFLCHDFWNVFPCFGSVAIFDEFHHGGHHRHHFDDFFHGHFGRHFDPRFALHEGQSHHGIPRDGFQPQHGGGQGFGHHQAASLNGSNPLLKGSQTTRFNGSRSSGAGTPLSGAAPRTAFRSGQLGPFRGNSSGFGTPREGIQGPRAGFPTSAPRAGGLPPFLSGRSGGSPLTFGNAPYRGSTPTFREPTFGPRSNPGFGGGTAAMRPYSAPRSFSAPSGGYTFRGDGGYSRGSWGGGSSGGFHGGGFSGGGFHGGGGHGGGGRR